jgi:hypothetical protein
MTIRFSRSAGWLTGAVPGAAMSGGVSGSIGCHPHALAACALPCSLADLRSTSILAHCDGV